MDAPRQAFSVAELVRTGTTRADLRAGIRSGELTPLRHGIVRQTQLSARPLREQEYRDLVVATCKRGGDPVASHLSAAAVHGLPVVGGDLTVVHTTASRRSGGQRRAGVHRHPAHRPDALLEVDGIRITSVLRTLADVSRTEQLRTSVPMLDAALHARLVTREALVDELAPPRRLHGLQRARRAVRLSDGRSESPGESLVRLDCALAGITDLVPQVDLADAEGRWLGRVDLYDELSATAIEFDGLQKYGGTGMPDARSALIDEKRREDDLRRAGVTVLRVVWADLGIAGRVQARVSAAIAAGRRARAAGLVSAVVLDRGRGVS